MSLLNGHVRLNAMLETNTDWKGYIWQKDKSKTKQTKQKQNKTKQKQTNKNKI